MTSEEPTSLLPSHIAIIMDGNGRWAQAQGKKRVQGHKVGMERARDIVAHCGKLGVQTLTLFAFSSENWSRPEEEVGFLMNLFVTGLTRESKTLHKNNVQLRVIGDVSRFDKKLQAAISKAEDLTRNNKGIVLQIAANYGGKWDIIQAVNKLISKIPNKSLAEPVTEQMLESELVGSDLPHVDLMIRTGGEKRISNFLLWQCAYSELYFSEKLWPEFNETALDAALSEYSNRQRRFGQTSEQVMAEQTK
ncbi:MAG: di-trans,poly-cis-decaprenylcistransferase [Gammaproteobacteria bacterium]|nr:di-trans,poly-cis-decaprenylcistransferase [Gammaproteobacteria bacterium]